jgi:transposase
MKYYAGLDVSMKETFVSIVDESGKLHCEKEVSTDPTTIANFLLNLDITIEVAGLESGSLSHWLTSELKKLDVPIICIDARHISAVLSVKINKTDKNDARGIADAMRCNLYKPVNVKNRGQIALCTLLNSRKQLVDQRVQLMGCIRGLLKPYGIRLGSLSKNEAGLEVIKNEILSIPHEAQVAITQLLVVLKGLLDAIKKLDKEVLEQIKKNDQASLLMTIPGIGAITALRFLAEICNPSRFHKSKSVGAYVGMTPRQYSSGETQKQGRISKCGPKELRSLLTEAGIVILTRTKSHSKLKAWGQKLQRKHGIKKAATALGRKLSVMMHRMLITDEEFKYTDKEAKEKKKQAA